jgi:methyl-accepting chemotaxis protein
MNIDIEKEILNELSEVKKLNIPEVVEQVEKVQDAVQEVVEQVVEKVQDAVEKVQDAVEKVQDVVENVVEELIENKELSKTVVRVVETVELQKTFQCCLPFLSRFLEKKKAE